MELAKYLVAILSGLATAIPLLIKLVEYVRKATREKNWNILIKLVMSLMSEAETKFAEGADRKKWVLSVVNASANTINYDVDIEAVGELIDGLCGMSEIVNGKKAAEG